MKTFSEILEWYDINVVDKINIELLHYMTSKHIVDAIDDKCSLDEINTYLLSDDKINDKFKIKQNKLKFIQSLEPKIKEEIKTVEEIKTQTIQQVKTIPFKLKVVQGKNKKMKLVKL